MAFISSTPLATSRSQSVASSLKPLPGLSIRRPLPAHTPHVVKKDTRSRVIKSMAGPPTKTYEADTPKKKFMERLKELGMMRFVVRNPTGILECMGTFDSLFYAKIASGEYANVVDLKANIDMHLLLPGFSGVKFEVGTSRSKERAPLYTLRILGEDKKTPALSLFVMNQSSDPVEPDRIQAWKDLKKDYVESDDDNTFFFSD